MKGGGGGSRMEAQEAFDKALAVTLAGGVRVYLCPQCPCSCSCAQGPLHLLAL